MARIGKLLLALFDTLAGVLEALGLGGARWEWKKQSWRRRIEEKIAGWENLERGARVRTRMCRECRALVPRGARVCPECGALMERGGGAGRWLQALFPGTGSLTNVLIGANFLLTLLAVLQGGEAAQGRGMFGLLAPSRAALFLFGAKWTPAIYAGQAWRLVTAIFLHGGLLHLLFNCYALANLGPLIENSFGRRKYFLIYLSTGLASFVSSMLFSPYSLSVGASGAIFGLLGLAVVYGRLRGGRMGREIADQLMRWVILGLLMFFIPGIDSAAHFGGLLSGGALGLFVDVGEPRRGWPDTLVWILTWGMLLAVLGSALAMLLSYRSNLALIQAAG